MDSKIVSVKAKPLLLKDYLLDDMSSCSSNGFNSFPRRPCCTTIRFLLEIDLKNKPPKKYSNFKKNPPNLLKSPSKSALSAFQSVITAVKRLPFAAGRSAENKKSKKSILPRSISKKILKKSSTFWKRKSNSKEIHRLKSFDELLKEDSHPLDRSDSSTTESKSNCWSGSDVTLSDELGSSGNFKLTEVVLNLPQGTKDVAVEVPLKAKKVVDNKREVGVGVGVGVANGDVSTGSTASSHASTTNSNSSTATNNNTKKQWSNEEKEQFSPVSVLDCPFDDEDEVSSPFQHRLARMEGTKKKLMKKIQRFESLAQLEPVNLTKRFGLQPDSDNESTESPPPHSSSSSNDEKIISDNDDEEEDENEQKALGLLYQFKDTFASLGLKIKADKLVLDFFREKQLGGSSFGHLFEELEDWINGQKPRELFLEWEVQKNRQSYIKDMEKGGEWKTLDPENDEVTRKLETEVFAALLNELLIDMHVS